LVADSHSILVCFSQLLNVHGVNDVRQTEIYTAESLVHEPSASEVELVIEKLKSHKSPCFWFILMILLYWEEAYILQRKTQKL
jgi:hypothetical protein